MHALTLETYNLSKYFGALRALDGVCLRVRPGSVHALLGENGAGKSTLVKCIVGYYRPDDGAVMIDGRERDIHSPTVARELGIGMVYQHFTVVPGMTVAENLLLARGKLPALINWKKTRAELEAFLDTTPFRLDLDATPLDLSAGEKQKLEILKQLYLKPRLLILDEPTSVLTPQEADEVLGVLRARAHAGDCSVILITHKFREVLEHADDVSVLRRGKLVDSLSVAETTPQHLAHAMVGQGQASQAQLAVQLPVQVPVLAQAMVGQGQASQAQLPVQVPVLAQAVVGQGKASQAHLLAQVPVPVPVRAPHQPGAVQLRIDGLQVLGDRGEPAVRGFALELRRGEIVGVAGVSGNGQRELMQALTGQRPRQAGTVQVAGRDFRATRRQNRELKVRSLPEEPLANACVSQLSVAHNMGLRQFDEPPFAMAPALGGWVRWGALRKRARDWIAEYGVKTQGERAAIGTLSGGNVQRAVLARELAGEADLLLVSNPVFGLDFAAVAEIHGRLLTARNRGAAVLLVSEDLDELLALSDRIVVMSEGRIVFEVPAASADRRELGAYMGGKAHGALAQATA